MFGASYEIANLLFGSGGKLVLPIAEAVDSGGAERGIFDHEQESGCAEAWHPVALRAGFFVEQFERGFDLEVDLWSA